MNRCVVRGLGRFEMSIGIAVDQVHAAIVEFGPWNNLDCCDALFVSRGVMDESRQAFRNSESRRALSYL